MPAEFAKCREGVYPIASEICFAMSVNSET